MTTTLRLARAVDNLERYNITRSNTNIYHNVVIGNKLQAYRPAQHLPPSMSTPPDRSLGWAQLLLEPLSRLIHQHPTLSVVIGDHLSAKPVFLRLSRIDIQSLIRAVSVKNAEDIAQIMEEEHNRPFDLSNHDVPLWRLVIVTITSDPFSSFYLLYTFHHVIGDGRSAMALTEQLIDHLNIQAQTEILQDIISSRSPFQGISIPVRSTKPIPASIEARIDCFPSFRTLLFEATRAILLPGFVKKALEIPYWAGEIDSSLDVPNRTELAFMQLNQDETSHLIRAAKQRSTTVQSILSTAAIFATKVVFMSYPGGDEIRKKDEALVFATPVSLRNLVPDSIAPEDQGNYTSEIIHNNIRISEESSFWEMTRHYRLRVTQATTTPEGLQDLLEHFGMLSLLPKKNGAWEKFMASKVIKDQHGRKASIKLSNLGLGWTTVAKADTTRMNEFLVQDAVFSQSAGVTASALTINVATANGVLTATTTWQKAAFRGRARGEQFMSEFKRILMMAIEEGRDEFTFSEAKSRV
ncbi:hypothetical protein BGX28_008974 [Mortierella sp. GBA30]|nr:hypothetical protein BGX28_008974 [Mortierella sp. GBA30]